MRKILVIFLIAIVACAKINIFGQTKVRDEKKAPAKKVFEDTAKAIKQTDEQDEVVLKDPLDYVRVGARVVHAVSGWALKKLGG